jgi:hypothetical protein
VVAVTEIAEAATISGWRFHTLRQILATLATKNPLFDRCTIIRNSHTHKAFVSA